MLAYRWFGESGTPVVFLHGLLGAADDWANVFALLQIFPQIRPLAIDLPYHAESRYLTCRGFPDARQQLDDTLRNALGEQPFYLVGYSLGGRLALDYALNVGNPFLLGTILEGANVGLQSEPEKNARRQNDQQWAARFRSDALEEVLNDWYQQPVFADLTPNKRSELVKKRQNNDGKLIAEMLLATSLAEQGDFSVRAKQPHIHFLIGERDHKFRQMADKHQLHHRLIANAGHNAHQANPQAFVTALLEIIRR